MAEVIYKVVSGDNLSKIARAYNTTVGDLVKWNNIKNPNLIFVGQEIKIIVPDAPAAPAAQAAPAAEVPYITYKIVPGDNLTKIARQFGTTVDALVKLNNIANPNLIYAGSELKIPAPDAKAGGAGDMPTEAEMKAAAAEEAAAKAAAEAEAAKKAAEEAAAKAAAEADAAKKSLGLKVPDAKKSAQFKANTPAQAAAAQPAVPPQVAAQKAAQDAQTTVAEEKSTFASKLSGLFKK